MQYRRPQRAVPARIHTSQGWIAGTFHLPRLHGFLEFLQQDASYFNLTDVLLPRSAALLPFFALRRTAVHLIWPTCPEWRVGLGACRAAVREHLVSCLLDAGMVAGKLEMLPDMRVSDFAANHDGFVVLRHAVLGPARVAAPLLLVNTRGIVGIADLGPTRAAAGSAGEGDEAEESAARTGETAASIA